MWRYRRIGLEDGDWIARRARGADNRQWREDIGEKPGFALDQPVEGHALLEMDAVLHDQVLMTRMKDFRINRRNDFHREIVGAHDANLQARKPARAFQPDARRAVVERLGLGVPARPMAGAHENRVARRDRLFRQALAFKAGFEVGELDFLADIEDAPLETLHIEQDAAREEGRRIL